ncbi:Killer toxin subunits alpha/beta 6 [Colletotrichum chlorophyti]|uniref:chitinase n=1 Tax=Colletotrichum chlorophyti TaxID=708187 RepID=A0A1Q8RWI5_9PEZI|nr:Killer toxin subunits alpha/beta 6 [Colletotrichum chlorophyti]
MRLIFRLVPLLLLQQLCSADEVDLSEKFVSVANPCPAACEKGKTPGNWTFYHDTTRLDVCDQPILLDFNLYNPIDDPQTHLTIRACTLGDADTKLNFLQQTNYTAPDAEKSNPELSNDRKTPIMESELTSRDESSCGASTESSATAQLSWWGSEDSGMARNVITAAEKIQEYLRDADNCDRKVILGFFKGSLVGVYSGSSMDNSRAASTVLKKFIDHIKSDGISTSKTAEVCGKDFSSSNILGVVADTTADFSSVQRIIKGWNDAVCVSGADGSSDWKDTKVWSVKEAAPLISERSTYFASLLSPRADCRTIRVDSGNTCATLASRCGIGATAFMQFNKKENLCATLAVGQPVCCSSGTLPDIRPKPSSDGTCAVHAVQTDEYCQLIASSNGLELKDLDEFNKETWGWSGCKNLQAGIRICVSKGKPPMPAPVSNAVCGPTVLDTKPPKDGEKLADLNPCVLNVCCNIWGQCGTTKDFCTVSKSETGNPGTAEPGVHGCVSNCGMEIVNNKEAPSTFRKVGYFEAWNFNRKCLNMHVGRIDDSYTHIHFSFGEISKDYQVVIPEEAKEQWDYFKKQSGPKKILAFGGWSFSTEYDTSPIFAASVSPANRALFADRVVEFAKSNGLNGLDFDWEYPGQDDIEGSVKGTKDDGKNYLEFLKLVRQKMPKDMTLSIAAPASFWYLKGFPIKDMAPVLDYITYMTYDLHGQWDAGSLWANPGCPSGSCLRSHVNYTETYNSLAMITKAGVPSHKVVVGVSSYGRSFKMSSASCRGPDCTFLGDRLSSPAKVGRCTGTGGYLANAEINEIIEAGGAIKQWRDDTDSDYLVYEGTEWVAYMSDDTKAKRTEKYKSLNFGGTSDWAVDLQENVEA